MVRNRKGTTAKVVQCATFAGAHPPFYSHLKPVEGVGLRGLFPPHFLCEAPDEVEDNATRCRMKTQCTQSNLAHENI
jgi:hypothetical protein